ncbi:hypothetical protein [Kushneria indalinina]|uniref:Uncharacterized protein n=1 Tax=Kushneria indalinina DSM 14324 TaxID=1122140 RepID=A0A3D9DUL0_9GAMM|nr:hypothetical protein [Kushneria indalinina]REC94371.1 hypothetical protein C8D72_2742 [Kushneria indalinina DSM 14324]
MTNFLIIKLLDKYSISVSETSVYGTVEIRPHGNDFPFEIDTFKKSANSHGLDYEQYMFSARVATCLTSKNIQEALNSAENTFNEILDLKAVETSISKLKISSIGLIKNMDTGETFPLEKVGFEGAMGFLIQRNSIRSYDWINYLLSLDNDLSQRYSRSLHWSRKSNYESNKQLRILFNWFALEALLKESVNDNIVGMVRWFLGFPNGKHRKDVTANTIQKLETHKDYSFWAKKLVKDIDSIRNFRNDSVHSGFRIMDFEKNTLELYENITKFSVSRCQGLANTALLDGLKNVEEFKENVGILFEKTPNAVNDVHNTIIYSLNNPDLT